MMILIYIASLKHTSCQIFKEMHKIRIMGFHQPPSTILFDDSLYPIENIEAFGVVYLAKKAV